MIPFVRGLKGDAVELLITISSFLLILPHRFKWMQLRITTLLLLGGLDERQMSRVKTIIIDFSEISAAFSGVYNRRLKSCLLIRFFFLIPLFRTFYVQIRADLALIFFYTSFLLPVLK